MSNVQYIFISKQLTSIQDFFGILSQLCQGKGYKAFSHSKCRHGQHNTVSNAMLPTSYESSEPALDYGLNNPGFKSQQGQEIFILLKNVHITSGAHPATYFTGTGILSQGINLTIHSI